MWSNFTEKLGFCFRKTDVSTEKIDGNRLEILGIVIALFYVDRKKGKSRFFEENFLLVDISINIAIKILFFTLNNIEFDYNN